MVPLKTTIHPYGKVCAVAAEDGERFYWLVKRNDVTLMPACVIEPLYARSLSAQLETRLRVPCTCAELAVAFDRPADLIRAMLYQLKRQGRAVRMDKRVPKFSARGRQYEHLWKAI